MSQIEQWTIGLVYQSIDSIVCSGISSNVKWLAPSAEGFFADPYLISTGCSDNYIFAEHYNYGCQRGVISKACFSEKEIVTQDAFTEILNLPCHLSYPSVFKYKNRYLMLVEGWESNGLLIYHSNSIEGPWSFSIKLFPDIPVVDPTLVLHNNIYWLFYTRQDDKPNQKLFLSYAPTPFGPWVDFQETAIRDSPFGSRPAGQFFRLKDGTLVRSGQDCSFTYGGGVVLFKVEHLGLDFYSESFLRLIPPVPGEWQWGLHTLCPVNDRYCLIDGKRWVADTVCFWSRAPSYLSKAWRRLRAPFILR